MMMPGPTPRNSDLIDLWYDWDIWIKKKFPSQF